MSVFKCLRCGECCHDIPLTRKELKMFKKLLSSLNRPSIDDRVVKTSTNGLKYRLNGICPFLTEDNLCEIYDFKPHICDIYPLSDNCSGYRKDKLKRMKNE